MQSELQSKRFQIGFTTKMLSITFGLLFVVVAVNYVVFTKGYRHSMLDVYVEEASLFTAVAKEAQKDTSKKLLDGTIDTERLIQLTEDELESGVAYTDSHYFNTLPVVVGWHDAGNAAENDGIDFDLITEDPRLSECTPVQGSFSAGLYAELRTLFDRDGTTTISRVDDATNSLHFLRIVTVSESDLVNYGDAALHDQRDANGNFDGLDVFGFRMEGWGVGHPYGAYEVRHSLDTLDASVASFFKQGLMYSIPISIAVGGLFIFMLRRMLSNPLRKIVQGMQEAGAGNFTGRIELKQNDEMGVLAHWFNTLLDNLNDMISEVRSASQSVASASGEIAASAEEMATGLLEQEQQTQQVAAAVEELSKSVSEVAAKSSEATSASESSQHLAEDGGDVVRETVNEMEGIAFEVNASASTVNSLGEQSQKIGEIIAVINDIADQTNLLALNAAIEAARAGEHGRGFAVVADEVRKLAERTTQATEEVSTSIRGIQSETNSAVDQIESSSNRVGRGVELASQAGQSLETIVDGSKSVQRMVHDIAAAANEQASASDEIARAIESISSVTRQSSVGAGQASQAAADLAHQSEHLMCLVEKFKTN